MAATSLAAPTRGDSSDIDRFRAFLHDGFPGAHGYVLLLGLDTFDLPDLLVALAKGFGYRAFERLQRNTGLPVDTLLTLVGLPRRTLTRRKAEGRFLPEESDRLLRASRLVARALELFEGDLPAAMDWLTAAQPALGGAAPLALGSTDVGAREVERLILRLEHGVFS